MKRKTFKVILLILVLIFAFLVIRSTYSKYLTQTDDNASLHIANWNIKLNDKDISEAKNFTNNVPITLDENPYIENDLIAPTSVGSFRLKLESTGTELPFKYNLTIAGEESFDAISTYKTELGYYNYDSLTNTTSFDFKFILDYSGGDPVKYLENSQEIYIPTLVTFSLPQGDIDNVSIASYSSLTYENNTINIVPLSEQWNNNVFSLEGHLSYKGEIKKEDIDFKNVFVNGTIIGTPVDIPDFRITSYTKNGSEPITVNINTNFSDIVKPPVDENGNFTGEEVINDYTFYFEWYDGEGNILNNQDDVNITKITSSAYIPLSLKITQIEDNNL